MGKSLKSKKKQNQISSGVSRNRKFRRITILSVVILIGIGIVILSFFPPGNLFDFGNSESSKREQALEYDAYAAELLEPIKKEMSKTLSPYKFVRSSIENVEQILWKGLELDSTLTTAWEKLGYITAQFHGKQALLRYESYQKKGDAERMLEEERNVILYFSQADVYYNKALEFGHPHPDRIHYLKGEALYDQYNYDGAAFSYTRAIELNPDERKYKSRLIDAYLYGGNFELALRQIEKYRKEYPDSELPFRNLGGYYMFTGDTVKAVSYYIEAVELGTKPEVGRLLYKYFSDRGENEKAEYYLQKAMEAEVTWDPETY